MPTFRLFEAYCVPKISVSPVSPPIFEIQKKCLLPFYFILFRYRSFNKFKNEVQ